MLGLGAKVSRQSNTGLSNDPIERKLHAKLDVGKRKSAISIDGDKEIGPISHSPGPEEWWAPCNTQVPPYQPKAEARLARPKARSGINWKVHTQSINLYISPIQKVEYS